MIEYRKREKERKKRDKIDRNENMADSVVVFECCNFPVVSIFFKKWNLTKNERIFC